MKNVEFYLKILMIKRDFFLFIRLVEVTFLYLVLGMVGKRIGIYLVEM